MRRAAAAADATGCRRTTRTHHRTGRVAAPELAQDRDRLVGPRTTLAEVDTERIELRLEIARSDAEDQTSVGEHVQTPHLLASTTGLRWAMSVMPYRGAPRRPRARNASAVDGCSISVSGAAGDGGTWGSGHHVLAGPEQSKPSSSASRHLDRDIRIGADAKLTPKTRISSLSSHGRPETAVSPAIRWRRSRPASQAAIGSGFEVASPRTSA